MGGSAGKYMISASSEAIKLPEGTWIAQSSTILTLKRENFQNSKPIGKGKFGFVFLAMHSTAKKYVAIKYIPKQTIFDFQCIHKIQLELDYLNKFDFPFIVHYFGAFETPENFAIVTEFAFGGELYHRMKKSIKFPENEAKFYFCELSLVLKYLHEEMGVVYRDLKPENILIDHQGHIKLCDFGFTRHCEKLEESEENANTNGGDLRDNCGTVMYIAPEIASGKKSTHGFPVDWWALGCILYEMLSGQAPFGDSDHANKFEIFNNITEKSPSLSLSWSSNLKNIIRGLLNKKPTERYRWEDISSSPWFKDIVWDDFKNKKILPPWIPTEAKEAGSVENFVNWDFSLPTTPPGISVTTYCSSLNLPKGQSLNRGSSSKAINGSAKLVSFPDSPIKRDMSSFKMASSRKLNSSVESTSPTSLPNPNSRSMSLKRSDSLSHQQSQKILVLENDEHQGSIKKSPSSKKMLASNSRSMRKNTAAIIEDDD